ncbi:MAG: gliding motility-associated ABC transporter substrate-binding protein GldG [Opitutaceae bacterium]|nr:gliding motility-associated ABC transporter substrate-binding protein GldG [Cytophagales bacterium]
MHLKKSLKSVFLLILILIVLQVISYNYFFRIDLTEDKRHTISPATKAVLRELKEAVLIKVYLEGELPAGFRQLKTSILETLNEFQVYGKANIQFEFIDPELITDNKNKNEFMISMAEKGIQPTNIFIKEQGQKIEKLIFPGATISYLGKERGVMLLKGSSSTEPTEILNQSAENIEYELVSAIKSLSTDKRKRIAILTGHGEPESVMFSDLASTLKESYEVKRLDITKTDWIRNYDAIILAQPTQLFNEGDILKIDQFIMRGGKAMFLIDPIRIKLDSMGSRGTFIFPYELGLDDMLFKYGIRLNKNLIQDLYCTKIPMTVGNLGDKPRIELVPWTFFPLLNNYTKHPLTKSLDAVQAKFLSSLDTVKAVGIRKTPILSTSEYTKITSVLGNVDLNQMRNDPNPKNFIGGSKTICYLLEGKFKSVFAGRPGEKPQGFMPEGIPGAILVMSDGDVALNDLNPKSKEPLPLGFDPYQRRTYSNKDFLVNSLNYMLDENGLIGVKNKELALRPLDKAKVKEQRLKYQVINVIAPSLAALIFWVSLGYFRKRKMTKVL